MNNLFEKYLKEAGPSKDYFDETKLKTIKDDLKDVEKSIAALKKGIQEKDMRRIYVSAKGIKTNLGRIIAYSK